MKKELHTGFADLTVQRRKIKDVFLKQVDEVIDWNPISIIINQYYKKGIDVCGRPSYPGLMLFKICLLETWYNLSDYEVEDQVIDRISFSKFVGLSLDFTCPDNSVISRFRTELTNKDSYEKLFNELNNQLEKKKIIIKTGIIIDASVTDTLRKPRGKKKYEAVEDRKEEQSEPSVTAVEIVKPGVDTDAKWIKKANKLHYGYKQHTGVDENGLVLGVITTPANESDIIHLTDVIDKISPDKGTYVMADKGYKSKSNDKSLEDRGLENKIMFKAFRGTPLTDEEKTQNKEISKTRYRVERTFGGMKRWFGAGTARYVGLAKMHTQHLMEAMAHNLYRMPGIIMSNSQI